MKMKFFAGAVMSMAFVLCVSTVNAQQKKQNSKTDSRFDMTTFSGESQINFQEDGHRYKIKLNGSKISEMYVDDKKVEEADYPKYDSMIKKILAQVEQDRKQAEKDREQAEKDRQQADKDRGQAELDRKQADKDREHAEQDRKQADKDREHADQDRKQADNDRQQAEKDREQADKDRMQADLDKKQAEKDREQADKDRIQAGEDRKQAEIDRKQAEEDRKLMDQMLTEVVNEKLVENKAALKSLQLDDKEFTVNGVKQSDALHSKFKAKYLKSKQNRINYRNADGFRGISID